MVFCDPRCMVAKNPATKTRAEKTAKKSGPKNRQKKKSAQKIGKKSGQKIEQKIGSKKNLAKKKNRGRREASAQLTP